ncbi:MAG TPA: HAD-IA family hydrolase [Stellaceae bacterium]|nr:HAD-IA family hydrolase [Stellaceae bacterium]
MALITNGAAEPQRAKVVRFALEHRFDHIQIEGEHGFGKPEERAYTHAMEALGVGPHETWMVGDNLEWEIVAPQRLGIYAIWHDGYGVGRLRNSPARPHHLGGVSAGRWHYFVLWRAPPPARRPARKSVMIMQPDPGDLPAMRRRAKRNAIRYDVRAVHVCAGLPSAGFLTVARFPWLSRRVAGSGAS